MWNEAIVEFENRFEHKRNLFTRVIFDINLTTLEIISDLVPNNLHSVQMDPTVLMKPYDRLHFSVNGSMMIGFQN